MLQLIYTITNLINIFSLIGVLLCALFENKIDIKLYKGTLISKITFVITLLVEITFISTPSIIAEINIQSLIPVSAMIVGDVMIITIMFLYEAISFTNYKQCIKSSKHCFQNCLPSNVKIFITKTIDEFKTDLNKMYAKEANYDCTFADNIINDIIRFDEIKLGEDNIPDDISTRLNSYYGVPITHVEIKNNIVYLKTESYSDD